MQGRLFTQPETKRFDQCDELKQLNPIFKELKLKEVELKTAADTKGAASVDFKKHAVIAYLNRCIEAILTRFNESPQATNHELEERQMLELVKQLQIMLFDILNHHLSTVNEKRNNHKELGNSAVKIGFLGTAFIGTLAVPLTFLGAVATTILAWSHKY